jgi:hypothetical protein
MQKNKFENHFSTHGFNFETAQFEFEFPALFTRERSSKGLLFTLLFWFFLFLILLLG